MSQASIPDGTAHLAGPTVERGAPYGIPGLLRGTRLRQPDTVACEESGDGP